MRIGTTRSYRFFRKGMVAATFFWIIQVVFGLPSIFLAIDMLVKSKVEGALFSIALFLAWIGATLAVGVASLIHGEHMLSLPSTFEVSVAPSPSEVPPEYDQEYQGYPFRTLTGGQIEVFTKDGALVYRNWDGFVRAIGAK